tara:strand:+ start:254 stop:478 length:225 start_codon:yes stop_codon:yes gene_type:complete
MKETSTGGNIMKITDIDKDILDETTSAGSVASVATPVGGMISRQMKNADGTAKNALDIDANILGHKKKKKKNKR